MPSATARPWKMFLPLGGVVLLGLLWTGYWFVASAIAKDRVAQERAALAAKGLELACAEEGWGGYPFHFEFSCTSPRLTLEDKGEAKSGKLLLVALAYAPWQVVALMDGPTTLAAAGIPETTVVHQRVIAAVTLDRDGTAKLSSEIPSPSVAGRGSAGKIMLHMRPAASGGTDVAVSAVDLNVDVPDKPPLAIDKGEVLATLLPDGSLKIDSFALEKGQLRYWGSGAARLDEARRPTGKIETETNDLDGLLTFLSPYLELTDQQKTALRSMLGLLGNEAKAPLLAKDGILYLGPFRIADLQPLY